MSASVFEKFLPDDDAEQLTVVFDLCTPLLYSIWRDACSILLKECGILQANRPGNKMKTFWSSQGRLQKFRSSPNDPRLVKLGSDVSAFSFTTYFTQKLVRSHPSAFVKPCALHCVLAVDEKPVAPERSKIAEWTSEQFAFELDFSDCRAPKSSYAALQRFVTLGKHTANEVLALQSQCPSSISLEEFVEFGSLRLSARLQWHNLYRALHRGSLSLHEIAVVQLISCMLWEAGECSDPPARADAAQGYIRDTHQALDNTGFAGVLFEELQNRLGCLQDDWSKYWALYSVIIVAQRMISLLSRDGSTCSAELVENLRAFLVDCKKTARGWIDTIDALLSQEMSKEDKVERRGFIMDIAMIGILASSEMPPAIDDLPSFLVDFLYFRVVLQDNRVLLGEPANFRKLVYYRSLDASVRICKLLTSLPDTPVQILAELFDRFSNLTNFVFNDAYAFHSAESGWHIKAELGQPPMALIDLNASSGELLFNGHPLGRLDTAVTESPLFQRTFANEMLRPRPSNFSGAQEASVQMNDSIHTFVFQVAHDVCIYERSGDKLLKLLDRNIFRPILPVPLVDDYSHWISVSQPASTTDLVVYFRRVHCREEGFFDHLFPYKLIFSRTYWTLIQTADNARLVSTDSKLWKTLFSLVSSIERREHTLLWLPGTLHVGTSENDAAPQLLLPRYGLSFCFRDNNFFCNEMMPHRIDVSGKPVGTLLGLKPRLVLVACCGEFHEERKILVPNGELSVSSGLASGNQNQIHHNVELNLSTPMRFIGYVAFSMDPTLGQLLAPLGQAEWLRLALLHALTSGVTADPFTKMTGTESAVTILNSSRCFSNAPRDESSLCTINAFAKQLVPKRKFFPSHLNVMQEVQWPPIIPSLCAFDGFLMCLEKLLKDSTSLSFLYPDLKLPTQTDQFAKDHNRLLATVEYRRCEKLYPQLALVHSNPVESVHEASSDLLFCNWTPRKDVAEIANAVMNRTLPDDCGLPSESELLHYLQSALSSAGSGSFIHELSAGTCISWATVKDRLGLNFFAVHDRLQKSISLEEKALMLSFLHFAMHLESSAALASGMAWLVALVHAPVMVLPASRSGFSSQSITTMPSMDPCFKSLELFLSSLGLPRYSLSAVEQRRIDQRKAEYESRVRDLTDELVTEVGMLKVQLNEAQWDKPFHYLEKGNFDMVQEFASQRLAQSWALRRTKSPYLHASYLDLLKQLFLRINKLNILQWYCKKVSMMLSALNIHVSTFEVNDIPAAVVVSSLPPSSLLVEIPKLTSLATFSVVDFLQQRLSMNAEDDDYSIVQQSYFSLQTAFRGLHEEGNVSDAIVTDFINDLDLEKNVDFRFQSPSDTNAMSNLSALLIEVEIRAFSSWASLMKHIEETLVSAGLGSLNACGALFRHSPHGFLTFLNELSQSEGGYVLPQLNFVTLKLAPETLPSLQGPLEQLAMWQKVSRCVKYAFAGHHDWVARELDYVLDKEEHLEPPSFSQLLFELDNNLAVRPVQAQVARCMISPPSKTHTALQLNMGEGKTSVIMPMVACELADATKLVRVIVLGSHRESNHNQLAMRVGGLLNRRVYSLPFSRDVVISSSEQLDAIFATLQECMQLQGVVMSTPEHILSLQLKYLELRGRASHAVQGADLANLNILANRFAALIDFLTASARDVIDEVDAVLHHQYQLVYTIGDQLSPDGSSARWACMQSVLRAVHRAGPGLPDAVRRARPDLDVPEDAQIVECAPVDNESASPYQSVRLLGTDDALVKAAYDVLCTIIVNDETLRSELHLHKVVNEGDRPQLERCLLNQAINPEDERWLRDEVYAPAGLPQINVLILRGILAFEVLLLILRKRFRVDYGIDDEQLLRTQFTEMSVPFRAKDTPADRAEFGHLDVAIGFTQLSYYQTGLSDDRIEILLNRLSGMEARDQIYEGWIEDAGWRGNVPPFSSINQRDPHQMRVKIYPFLRFHISAIDFYLSNIVFPKFAKQFPQKLTASAWDLCPAFRAHPVTGFSGTNDTRHLLPGKMAMIDPDKLPNSLKKTNALMCMVILHPRNAGIGADHGGYLRLQVGFTGEDLLAILPPTAKVLIDPGALLIDLSNKEVALLWLEARPEMKAVVYFEGNSAVVTTREARDRSIKLHLSSFHDNMKDVLVYIDDVHCRGTDFRIPNNTLAAVTLGKGLTKDKFVQACMRMRRLLNGGHTLCFIAPNEVDMSIGELARRVNCSNEPANLRILLWCLENSVQATKNGFVSWARQGVVHTRSGAALKNAVDDGCTVDAPQWKLCFLSDMQPLTELYLHSRPQTLIPQIVNRWITELLPLKLTCDEMILHRCERFVPHQMRSACVLDEMQEREIEEELEEERCYDPPAAAQACKEIPSDRLWTYCCASFKGRKNLLQGSLSDCSLSLWDCLQETQLGFQNPLLLSHSAWHSQQLRATKFFSKTVKESNGTSVPNIERFLRPVHWLLVRCVRDDIPVGASEDIADNAPDDSVAHVLAVSPTEASFLLQKYRANSEALSEEISLVQYSAPLRDNQSTLVFKPFTVFGTIVQRPVHPSSLAASIFAELGLFAGSIFLGEEALEKHANADALYKRLQLHLAPRQPPGERHAGDGVLGEQLGEQPPRPPPYGQLPGDLPPGDGVLGEEELDELEQPPHNLVLDIDKFCAETGDGKFDMSPIPFLVKLLAIRCHGFEVLKFSDVGGILIDQKRPNLPDLPVVLLE